MKAVGIRELKNNLSRYVRLVREGEEVLVTDRGEVVASLGPPRPHTTPELPTGLVEMARKGQITIGADNESSLYCELSTVSSEGLSSRLLNQERGEH